MSYEIITSYLKSCSFMVGLKFLACTDIRNKSTFLLAQIWQILNHLSACTLASPTCISACTRMRGNRVGKCDKSRNLDHFSNIFMPHYHSGPKFYGRKIQKRPKSTKSEQIWTNYSHFLWSGWKKRIILINEIMEERVYRIDRLLLDWLSCSHRLKVETGRWSRIPRDERTCSCSVGWI